MFCEEPTEFLTGLWSSESFSTSRYVIHDLIFFHSPVNPFASNAELRPPPTSASTPPSHSPQDDVFRSEIVVTEDMEIDADMKTKVISALSACIYNPMESFGLAGFLMAVVIPNIWRRADIKSEAVDFADVNTKVSSMTVVDIDEDTITGTEIVSQIVCSNMVLLFNAQY